jgi:hypothetical protein
MYCLYQSSGPLLGVGEWTDQAIEDGTHYAETHNLHLMDELGFPVWPDDCTDLTTLTDGVVEVGGDIYLRRCSLALYEEAYTAPDRSTLAYTIGADGVVRLATEGKGGPCDAQAPPY